MTERSIVLHGPFSDDDITAFWRLMQEIEARHPERTYRLTVVDPNSTTSTEPLSDVLVRVMPTAEGYQRDKLFIPLKPE